MGRHRISFVGTVKPKSQNQNSQQTKDEILLMVLFLLCYKYKHNTPFMVYLPTWKPMKVNQMKVSNGKYTIHGYYGKVCIPGSSRYVKFLPFGRFFGWKGTNLTHLEDPGIVAIPALINSIITNFADGTHQYVLCNWLTAEKLLCVWSCCLRVPRDVFRLGGRFVTVDRWFVGLVINFMRKR